MQRKLKLIVPLLLASIFVALVAAAQTVRTGGSVAWFGAFVASSTLPLYLVSFVIAGGFARTSPRLMPQQLIAVAGVVLSAYSALRGIATNGVAALVPLGLALVGLAVFEWFVFVYSLYGRKKSAAVILWKPLPEVEFRAMDGRAVSVRDFVGARTLLVFFRGNWCPLCMAQLRELIEHAQDFAALSVGVKLISNQSVEKMKELSGRLDLPAHFELLCDVDLRAAKTLSIEDIGGAPPGLPDYPADTVMATAIALDEEGRVVFGDETNNFRVRPHPESLLQAFRSL
ncbi:MAG: redoxin domain-containing protein [Pseudomonadota bacterium]